MVLKAAKNAIIIFLLLGIVCGVGYPALVTVIAQKAFPEQANGSIVYKDGKPVGSRLIGQEWTQPKYFWGRPSAIPGGANNAMTSTSSNDGPTSPWLINKVRGLRRSVRRTPTRRDRCRRISRQPPPPGLTRISRPKTRSGRWSAWRKREK